MTSFHARLADNNAVRFTNLRETGRSLTKPLDTVEDAAGFLEQL